MRKVHFANSENPVNENSDVTSVSLIKAHRFQSQKNDADIDGLKFFRYLDKKEVRKIVVSVRSSGIKPDDVRALNYVRERKKAEFALFLSLE